MDPEYIYISPRLVSLVIARGKQRPSVRVAGGQVGPPGAKLNLEVSRPISELHLDAERATEIAHDYTGTLDTSPGQYLGIRGDFRAWIFPFEVGQRIKVAWFAAVVDGALVVLCGRADNFLGHERPPEETGEWTPSDPQGLRQIVTELRKKDPTALLAYQVDEHQQREMAETVAYITVGLPNRCLTFDHPLDVFMRCYVDVLGPITGETLFKGAATFQRVIVGAPIWAREQSELALPGVKS